MENLKSFWAIKKNRVLLIASILVLAVLAVVIALLATPKASAEEKEPTPSSDVSRQPAGLDSMSSVDESASSKDAPSFGSSSEETIPAAESQSPASANNADVEPKSKAPAPKKDSSSKGPEAEGKNESDKKPDPKPQPPDDNSSDAGGAGGNGDNLNPPPPPPSFEIEETPGDWTGGGKPGEGIKF